MASEEQSAVFATMDFRILAQCYSIILTPPFDSAKHSTQRSISAADPKTHL